MPQYEQNKDEDGARRHELYQNPIRDSDGLYHCPGEGERGFCNHKPNKLKSNYELALSAIQPCYLR
jgi:hypothetical protein